jgi:glycosyltransferase involved in cell wall biosynthesis
MGHEVANHAWYGLQGGMLEMNGIRMYPKAFDPYGNDVAVEHYKHFKSDLLISLIDVWVLYDFGLKPIRWVPYVPIDSDPIPQVVMKALNGAYRVASYSRWGEKMLTDRGIKNTYIPHGVNTNVYTPMDKAEAKKSMGFEPEDFVVGMVAANKGFPSRKAFPENLAAFASLKKKYPKKKIKLYLHTLFSTQSGGLDLKELCAGVGLKPEDVRFCGQYQYILGFPESYMATAYNAMDVLLASTMGEGFGIPIIEAQACGTPVIVTNFSSMPELCFSGFIANWVQRYWTPLHTWQVIPSIISIMDGLEWALQRMNVESLRVKARKGAMAYDWDAVLNNYWKPFLDEIQSEIQGRGMPPSS